MPTPISLDDRRCEPVEQGIDYDVIPRGASPVGISWQIVRFCTAYQEIATAYGLAMTVVAFRWYFWFG